MNILADENLDESIIVFLRREGHDVLSMAEFAPGTQDADILQLAVSSGRIVVTFDRDFGELVYLRGSPAIGVLLLRIQPATPSELVAIFQQIWLRVANNIAGHFIVANKDKVRIRPLPQPPTA